MAIKMGVFFMPTLCCSICGVAMFVQKGDPGNGWYFLHPAFEEGCGRCQNEGLKFAPPMIDVRVIK